MDSLIQWNRAKYWTAQWNPVIGCEPCSPACEHCYAAAWAKRFGQSFEPHLTEQRPPRKGVVFCGNMTDLFGDWVSSPASTIKQCIDWRSDAIYLWLTKRIGNMCDALKEVVNLTTFQHYFGFTAEYQSWYNGRMDFMASHFPAGMNMWISIEPLLGEVNMRFNDYWLRPKWVVVGCESGPNRRPCKIEWVESIVEQCRAAGVPVFVKQLDLDSKCVSDINKFPKHLQIRQVPWAKDMQP